MLCRYKNILGEPEKGIHSYRFFGVAIMDVLMTLIGSILLSYLFHWSFMNTTICLFVLGIILHRLFCVRTTLDKLLP